MRKTTKAIVVVLLAVGALSCGGSNGPAAPSQPIQVAGLWRGAVRLTSVTGGECVGQLLQSAVGSSSEYSLSIQQTGATLTARSTDIENGITCDMTGTAGQNSISLNTTRCDAGVVTGIVCAPGFVRDIRLQAATVQASITGTSGTGTYAETYNVSNSFNGAGVGILTATGTLTMTRQ